MKRLSKAKQGTYGANGLKKKKKKKVISLLYLAMGKYYLGKVLVDLITVFQ